MDVHPIVRMIVDTRHVGESHKEVIREVISRLAKGRKTYNAMPRVDRRRLMAQCIDAHRENRDLYRHVMM